MKKSLALILAFAMMFALAASGSSGVGSSAENLRAAASDGADWLDGTRFPGGASESDIASWLEGLAPVGAGE